MKGWIAIPPLDQSPYQIISRNDTRNGTRAQGANPTQFQCLLYFNIIGRSRDPSWPLQLWPDLPKGVLHAHHDKTQVSPPMDSYINKLTLHMSIVAKGSSVCFYHGLFYRPVDVRGCSVVHQTAVTGLNRKPTGWELAYDSTVMLAMDLSTFCGTFSMVGPQLGPLTLVEIFESVNPPANPPPSTPRHVCFWYWWKKLSKMAGNSTSRPLMTVSTEAPCIVVQPWRIA